MDARQARRTGVVRRLVAVAAAALAALGVSGVYASTMSVSAAGHLGAGSTAVQSSCVTGPAAIAPLDSTKVWNTTANFWVYPDLTVSGDFHNCAVGDKVLVTIFQPGSAPTTVAADYSLRAADISSTASFTVTLATATSGTPYLPATAAATSDYGLLVHS